MIRFSPKRNHASHPIPGSKDLGVREGDQKAHLKKIETNYEK